MNEELPVFKIEKGIERPEVGRIRSQWTLFLMSLDVGDSFECTREHYQKLSSYQKSAKVRLSSSMVKKSDGGYYGLNDIVRVWRIE